MFSDFDRTAMQRALGLAARGLATTHPNPRVGCVIARSGRVIGEGWHVRAGESHAEVVALAAAGTNAAGATVYVTLEPCNHQGHTPPCVDALLAARVARVVYAVDDPNPLVEGGGAARLKAAGVAVAAGLMAAEATDLNAGFLKRMRTGRPWVRMKLAMSLDGRTALASGVSKWISSEAARADVQQWRTRSAAILTGVGTVLADDPRLDVRPAAEAGGEPAHQPLRVVLDSALRTPPAARILAAPGEALIITALAATDPDWEPRCAALASSGARIETLPADGSRVPLAAVLDRLGELEINELQVEAGPTLAGELLQQGLCDELLLYVAPKLLGPAARPLLVLPEPGSIGAAPGFDIAETAQVGDDLRLRLRPRAPGAAQPG